MTNGIANEGIGWRTAGTNTGNSVALDSSNQHGNMVFFLKINLLCGRKIDIATSWI